MPPSCSPVPPPPSVDAPIPRSRSRYKGPRLQKTLTNPSETPSSSAEQLQPVDNLAPFPREPRSQNNRKGRQGSKTQPSRHETTQRHLDSADEAKRSDAFLTQKFGSLREAKDRTRLQDQLISPPQALQGYQQTCPRRRYSVETEPHKEVSQGSAPSPRLAKSSEQRSHKLGPGLRSPNREESAATTESRALPNRGLTHRIAGHSNGKRLRKGREELKRTISAPIAIELPQSVAKPAFDAPVSAVNAGERRVKVLCDQKLISLPVTPSTTPLEIVRSATDQMVGSIDSTSTVLLESFKQLGLERPLRTYEHVRDVLNSWDNDTQNTLVIQSPPTDDWLDFRSNATSPLVDTSVHIHYSQRPGHWDKRWITLRSDGQMLVAKREGGETANICHMSDFDIYVPTARQLAKRIRPPRKICFAVKSQQKSSMFLSTANFVHFFSTSDKTLAAAWYSTVLQWRSWYLVNVMGEGEEGLQEFQRVSTKVGIQEVLNTGSLKLESQGRPPGPPSQGIRKKRTSTLARHSTEHLAPSTKPDFRHNVAEDSLDNVLFRSRSKNRSSQSKTPTKYVDTGTSTEHGRSFKQTTQLEKPEPFTATGLLGRTYTQRQNVQREREKVQNAGSDQPSATPSFRPLHHLNGTLSQNPKPKPLIDLTPQYQEPPQHAKKGKGVILEQIPAGGLVEVANTPEAAIAIPPATTWRRPTSKGRDWPSVGRSRTVQQDHSGGPPSKLKQTSTSLDNGDMAFTGGLVATNSRGQGGTRTSRGITKEALLDIGEEHQYAPGSLLECVGKQDGGVHPIG